MGGRALAERVRAGSVAIARRDDDDVAGRLEMPASETVTALPAISPATLLSLQRTAGNGAATRLLQRTKVNTNGGVFDNAPMYAPVNGTGAVGERVGANIMIDFTPGDLVEAPVDGVVLTQTVKAVTDHKPGAAALRPTRDQDSFASTNEDDKARFGPGGVGIDVPVHPGGRDEPSHNPIYGVGFGAEDPSTTLSGGTPSVGRTRRGAHVRNASTGALDPPVDARMEDGPGRVLAVAGQSFEMTFEVAALVSDGPMKDTYLGSIEWGWQSDATGTVTLKPFTALASGAPTATFMTAAKTWNDAIFHDQSFWGTVLDETVESVDLPLTTVRSGAQAAVDMTTADILARVKVVRAEGAALPAGPSVDRTNKEFELRALVTELAKRKINIELTCKSLSDTGAAARPPEDEIWLSLDGGGGGMGLTLTGTRTFRAGEKHTYEFPVTDFLPLTAGVHIDVNEHDRAGPGGRAHDDELIALDWLPPFATAVHADAGGHYSARVGFDK